MSSVSSERVDERAVKIAVNARNQAHTFGCEAGEKILHAGLRSGIALPYECGTGTCGTCKARLVEGDVGDEWPEAPGRSSFSPDSGEILMCQCVPRADCTLEVGRMVKTMAPDACHPRNLAAFIEGVTMLTHDVLALEVRLSGPLDFEAGQFVLMRAPRIAGARAYSMVNFAPKTERLVFVVKKKPDGRMTQWLFRDAVTGSRVDLFGPLGAATFDPGAGKNLLCIAGGSGIAGMMSILSRATQEHYFERHASHLFFGVRTRRDVFFLDELAAFHAEARGALRVTVAFSDEDVDPQWGVRYPQLGFGKGFVHAVAAEGMQGRWENVRAYAAGPPPMVDATLRMLLREGKLKPDSIRYDKFS
jgi:toluene monooxygenase electron transfer component